MVGIMLQLSIVPESFLCSEGGSGNDETESSWEVAVWVGSGNVLERVGA